jgi:hypothetical protein
MIWWRRPDHKIDQRLTQILIVRKGGINRFFK